MENILNKMDERSTNKREYILLKTFYVIIKDFKTQLKLQCNKHVFPHYLKERWKGFI